jgi:putative aldouronate transport system permease protein
MLGIILAFKNYDPVLGLISSPWVGMQKFAMFFDSYYFTTILKNTLGISLYALLINTPLPIILALLINEVQNKKFKKFVQTVSYAPYFISLVVLVGMFNLFLTNETGLVNQLLISSGIGNVNFLGNPDWFKTIYVYF